ncbi:MAG: hypothetical protein HZA54_12140 [Planctomycetes bacterium]|nr:hypothetical protein [Planctomycetota bacterium]
MWIGGEKRAERTVELAPGREAEARLEFDAPAPGAYAGTVRLVPGDALAADDARHFAVNVPEPVPVLLVGAAAEERDAAFYRAAALAPPGLAARRRLRITRATKEDLVARPLALYRAVLLAGASGLGPGHWKALGDYVEEGGGIAVFAATGAKAEEAASPEAARVLPVTPLGPAAAAADGLCLEVAEARHPLFAAFAGGRGGDLAGAVFRSFVDSAPARTPGAVSVLARFRSLAAGGGGGGGGRPALVERRLGIGRVLWFGGRLAGDASDFALRPSFPLFAHALVAYLTGETRVPREVAPGEVLRGVAEPQAGGVRVEWVGPPGTPTVSGKVDARSRVFTLADTELPGVYEARYELGGTLRRATFAVNPDPKGSDLARLGADELAGRLAGLPVEVREGGGSSGALARVVEGGAADWLPSALLVLVMVLLACESWLAART